MPRARLSTMSENQTIWTSGSQITIGMTSILEQWKRLLLSGQTERKRDHLISLRGCGSCTRWVDKEICYRNHGIPELYTNKLVHEKAGDSGKFNIWIWTCSGQNCYIDGYWDEKQSTCTWDTSEWTILYVRRQHVRPWLLTSHYLLQVWKRNTTPSHTTKSEKPSQLGSWGSWLHVKGDHNVADVLTKLVNTTTHKSLTHPLLFGKPSFTSQGEYQHKVPIKDLKQGNENDSLRQRSVTSITLATNGIECIGRKSTHTVDTRLHVDSIQLQW